LPPGAALLAALGPFRPEVLFSGAARNLFFREAMGIAHPLLGLSRIAAVALAYGAFFGAALLVALRVPRRHERAAAALVALLSAGLLFTLRAEIPWLRCALPFSLFVVLLGIVTARRLRSAADETSARRERLRLAFLVLALGFLAKLVLAPIVHHYGFVLAVPATLLLADAALGLLPEAVA